MPFMPMTATFTFWLGEAEPDRIARVPITPSAADPPQGVGQNLATSDLIHFLSLSPSPFGDTLHPLITPPSAPDSVRLRNPPLSPSACGRSFQARRRSRQSPTA